jgi:hypothetical protein
VVFGVTLWDFDEVPVQLCGGSFLSLSGLAYKKNAYQKE